MKTRWIAVLSGLALIGAIALMGVGMAQARGATRGFGPWATGQSATQQTPAGRWGPMMGGNQPNGYNGPGGMMGGGMMGGGMMGGYGSAQQSPASAAPVSGNAVTIQNFAFQPANVQVTVGTTVTWTNNDTAPHTVTFRDSSLTSSGILRQGDTYSYTFTKVGTFSYYCAVHTYMIGEVIVTAR
jgi:plastocyanin